MNKELNSRQWALYNFLKAHPDKMFRQIDIAYALKDYYDTSDFKDNADFHFSNCRKIMTADIRVINESDIIQKIIISTPHGIKIASSAEFAKYINNEFAAIFRKLERTRKKARKAGLDGQMKFVTGQQRDTVEAFADDINRLKAARLAAGLKLVDVAKVIAASERGFDVSLLSKMENGHCKPTERQLNKLAKLYNCEPLDLIDNKRLHMKLRLKFSRLQTQIKAVKVSLC